MGITLNGLSLLAMSLVAGVLVDDAIVEIENIVRHMRMGKSAYQASIDAADEIGLAVLATTMSIVAVFLPVALMPGISGQFFKSFGYTVVISVLMSLFVARMITPLIAAYFLRAQASSRTPPARRWTDIWHAASGASTRARPRPIAASIRTHAQRLVLLPRWPCIVTTAGHRRSPSALGADGRLLGMLAFRRRLHPLVRAPCRRRRWPTARSS